jgi:hypothetical protein
MPMIEDPRRQLSYLQQCLACDKKPLGLFLGAGCPTAIRVDDGEKGPLIPDIAGITLIVHDDLAKCPDCGPLLKIIEEQFANDGRTAPTMEDMLTHIRALRAVAGKDEVRGLTAGNLDKLDDAICQCINRVVDKTLPDSETPYHRTASWVDAVRRENPIEIFTTNYDLLMEQAFEDTRVPYFDGFAGVRKPFFDLRAMEEDMLPPRWARLWKLHGSINWYQVAGRGVFRGTTMEGGASKRVIHPSHLKYEESRRMPYLAMIDRLRAFMKQPTATLILCGYSFRDEHINEVIVQGLQSTLTTVAFALLFDGLATYSQATALALKRSNLSILARDGAVIGGQKANWLERDRESVSADDGRFVRWRTVDPDDKEGRLSGEFTLGDFAIFGQFLQELVGTVRQPPAVPNAR